LNTDRYAFSQSEAPDKDSSPRFPRVRKRWWPLIALGVVIMAQALTSAWFYATESAEDELSIRWHRVWTLHDLEQETRRLVEETDSIEALMAALEASGFGVNYTEWNTPAFNDPPPPMRPWPDHRLVQGTMSDNEVRTLHPGPPIWFKLGSIIYYGLSTSVSYSGPEVRRIHSSVSIL
jgi:hypothetical protein